MLTAQDLGYPLEMADLARRPRGLPQNAMLEQTQATHQRLYHLMGEPLLVRTDDPLLLDAAEETFGTSPQPRTGGHDSPLVMELFVQDPEHDAPSGERSQPIYRTHGHLFYITLGKENTAVVDLLSGYAFGFLSSETVRDRPTLRFTFLEGIALAMLGTARQFIPVHAACVVKEGLSLILQGKAGSGKSTLAYACVRRGYQLLAEDGLMIKCRSEGASLWGMPWKLHLLPDTKRFFPELREEMPRLQVNGEWKLEVSTEVYYQGSTTPSARPGPVVFLERGGDSGPSRLEPVSPKEALAAFEVVWPWWVGWTEAMEQQLPRLLEQGAFRLWMNGSPDEAVDCLDALGAAGG
jgi:hypothetical protein